MPRDTKKVKGASYQKIVQSLIIAKYTLRCTSCKLIPAYKCIPIIIAIFPPHAHFEVDSTIICTDFSKACFTVRNGHEKGDIEAFEAPLNNTWIQT